MYQISTSMCFNNDIANMSRKRQIVCNSVSQVTTKGNDMQLQVVHKKTELGRCLYLYLEHHICL